MPRDGRERYTTLPFKRNETTALFGKPLNINELRSSEKRVRFAICLGLYLDPFPKHATFENRG